MYFTLLMSNQKRITCTLVLKSSSFYTSNKPGSIKNNLHHHNACYITECHRYLLSANCAITDFTTTPPEEKRCI